jgi:hypothetical protein
MFERYETANLRRFRSRDTGAFTHVMATVAGGSPASHIPTCNGDGAAFLPAPAAHKTATRDNRVLVSSFFEAAIFEVRWAARSGRCSTSPWASPRRALGKAWPTRTAVVGRLSLSFQ